MSTHRRRAALAVEPVNHGNALQPRAIHVECVQQCRQPREADAVAVFRQVEHHSRPMATKL